ncbi:unnamed protein product [Urochloa decumbens]|uniref:F-box domain-containing protein n=1 Tax=Urochloa decumbens TaxID=240449 RepID=A0ABC9FU11_9POAL
MDTESPQAKIAKDRKRKRLPARAATSIDDLSDDLLELVLLGLDSPKWLLRGAATCKPWRRLVAGGAFLRRFRSIHAPPAVGTFYSINPNTSCSYGRDHRWPGVDPVFVPSSESASTPCGPNGRPQLSVDFVPRAWDGGPRELVDGRGSLHLLLMEKDRLDRRSCYCCYHHADIMTPDLVVCEPLTRRYLAIPPPDGVCIVGAFLRDGTAGIGMANFRVLLVLYQHDLYGGRIYRDDCHNGHGYLSASVFTNDGSNGGWWHHGEVDYDGVYLPRLNEIHLAGRTGGRIYWGCDDKQVLVLDEHTLKSSTMALSQHMMSWQEFGRDNFRVVGGGARTVRIVHLAAGSGELEVFSQAHGIHGTAHDWVLQ